VGDVAPAVRIITNSRRCVVPLDEVALLARELRRLPLDAYTGAVSAATILEATAAEETATDVTFTPEEEAALSRALHGLEVERGRLAGGLQELWDGIRIDSGAI
jgi:hypothetical protein